MRKHYPGDAGHRNVPRWRQAGLQDGLRDGTSAGRAITRVGLALHSERKGGREAACYCSEGTLGNTRAKWSKLDALFALLLKKQPRSCRKDVAAGTLLATGIHISDLPPVSRALLGKLGILSQREANYTASGNFSVFQDLQCLQGPCESFSFLVTLAEPIMGASQLLGRTWPNSRHTPWLPTSRDATAATSGAGTLHTPPAGPCQNR